MPSILSQDPSPHTVSVPTAQPTMESVRIPLVRLPSFVWNKSHEPTTGQTPPLIDSMVTDPPVPIDAWFFLTVLGGTPESFVVPEWFAKFESQHLIGIRPPSWNKPFSFLRDALNSDISGTYEAHKCTQDASTISLPTFRYATSPTYVTEAYASRCSVRDLLKRALL
ncbi:hypothetical protein BS47DRAFT_1342559, partial [Hydnum rufescens UP504]